MVIESDARHYKTDLLSTGWILISLAVIYFTGFFFIDAIVGFIYLISAILAIQVSLDFIWIALVTAALQIVSPLTKFCPVYAILNKILPDTTPIQDGN